MPQLPSHMYENKDCALDLLSSALHDGYLSICLGAGVSAGMGLPPWHTLVNQCCKAVNIVSKCNKNTPNEKLRSTMNKVERGTEISKYKEIIHDALYSDFSCFDIKVISKPLLVALGALISGSMRGRVTEVLTMNFDNVLEEYLRIYGMAARSIHKMPQMLLRADVDIYHLHGYLPFKTPEKHSETITFSKASYDKKFAKDSRDAMWEVIVNVLTTRLVLFVGLSGNDITFGPIFEDAKRRSGSNDIMGIWLFGESPSKEQLDEIRSWNCAPLVLSGFDNYPEFILKICELASNRSQQIPVHL